MRLRKEIIAALLLVLAASCFAQVDRNLLPKYGSLPKEDWQKKADDAFISGMDQEYRGDRKKAATDMALRGWQSLQSGDENDAMRRFNQAWLLDRKNGVALWGMAAVEADWGKFEDSLQLFKEADNHSRNDLNFQVDYARVVGLAGLASKEDGLLKEAYKRFRRIYEQNPQNVRNLQNWAKTLFGANEYAEAWSKVELAETTPDRNRLDPEFIAELTKQMPRPLKP